MQMRMGWNLILAYPLACSIACIASIKQSFINIIDEYEYEPSQGSRFFFLTWVITPYFYGHGYCTVALSR